MLRAALFYFVAGPPGRRRSLPARRCAPPPSGALQRRWLAGRSHDCRMCSGGPRLLRSDGRGRPLPPVRRCVSRARASSAATLPALRPGARLTGSAFLRRRQSSVTPVYFDANGECRYDRRPREREFGLLRDHVRGDLSSPWAPASATNSSRLSTSLPRYAHCRAMRPLSSRMRRQVPRRGRQRSLIKRWGAGRSMNSRRDFGPT